MKRTKRRPAKVQAKPSTTSTAIARIERGARAIAKTLRQLHPIVDVKPPALEGLNILGEEAQLGALGLVEVKLTDKEEAVLARPVNVDDILIKPSGQPYLSHPTYTKWFNEAFGRLGWSIVPRSKPMRQAADEKRSQVICPFVLYIHGQPAAFAMGEQDYYYNDNREQSYGDALEATVASALRRCAKRLGVGLELWDKKFLNSFIATKCEKVWRGTDRKPSWRLKTDAPFYDERSQQAGDDERGRQESSQQRRPPAAGHDGRGGDVITEKQLGRLWTIARRAKRTDDEVHGWLKRRYQIEHSRDITKRRYDEIVQWIEQAGPLPEE